MSEVYVVMQEDRHADNSPTNVTSTREKAEEIARELAKTYCRFDEDYEENFRDGNLDYINYSCEGDCVSIWKIEIE